MSGRNRGILTAAAGWVVICWGSPCMAVADVRETLVQQQISNSLGRIASSLEDAEEPERQNADCPKGIDDRKSDLCAQWKAADAAEASAVSARDTVTIGWIGLVFGAVTMGAAIAAAWYARRAAFATEGQLTLTKDQHKRTADASVSVHQVSIAAQGRGQDWFQIIAQNRGYANAVNCVLRADVALMTRPGRDPTELVEVWRQNDLIENQARIVSPGQSEYWTAPVEIIDTMISEYRKHKGGRQVDVFVHLAISYETELGDAVDLRTVWSGFVAEHEHGVRFENISGRHGATKETRRPLKKE